MSINEQKKAKRGDIRISEATLEKTKIAVAELNILFENYEKTSLTEHQITVKGQIKKADKAIKIPEKLTIKVFTEAALLHFIKNKFDPRYYQDDSIATAINRLRNHILGFIVMRKAEQIEP